MLEYVIRDCLAMMFCHYLCRWLPMLWCLQSQSVNHLFRYLLVEISKLQHQW